MRDEAAHKNQETRPEEQVVDEEALRVLRAASPALQEWWEGDDPSEWRGVKWGDGRVRELYLEDCPLKELPAQVGRLTGLTTLNLWNCWLLAALPAELGLLVNLTTLYLKGCSQLTALPAELGQLTALTLLDVRKCDRLTLLPGTPANVKETRSAPPVIAVYARLLIVQPRQNTPEQLHDFLLATPLAVPPFFKFILTDATHADWLGRAVENTPDLSRLSHPDGRRTIDVAVPACKQKMQAALHLLGRYDVEDGPLLHRSATSAVAAAADHADPERKPLARVALKAMKDVQQVRAELQGRAQGLKPEHVVAVRVVYVDKRAVDHADGEAWPQVQKAAAELGIEVNIISGLGGSIQAHLFPASKPHESDESVAAKSSKQQLELKRRASANLAAASSEEYKFLVVMDFADRSLKQTIDHEQIAGKDFYSVRAIAADLAGALDHLHSKGLIQGDHKPNNAVAFGGDWRLIDLDVACTVGEPFGNKVPSSGYCPPEMARVLLKATNDQGRIDVAKLAEYVADVSYDIWSFGTVVYHLSFGRPLWLTDVNDNVKPADLRTLAAVPDRPLRRALDDALADGEHPKANGDLRVATVLLRKLLEPDKEKRMEHFPKGMKDVLKELFFQSADLDAPTLQQILKGQEEMKAKLDVVIKMSDEQRAELLISRKMMIKAVFEATEVLTPTTFIILDKELPPELSAEQSKLLEVSLNEDGTGFEVSGERAEAAKEAKERFDTGMTWLGRLQTLGEGVIQGDADKVFGVVQKALGDLVTGKTMYFYLVDELTGKPVRGEGYPIKISTPSETVPKLLPVMQVGMRAMSLYNGVAGIAQMFAYPVPKLPEKWREGAQSSVELLKQESSVEKFGAVHEAVKAEQHGEDKTTRGASLRELQQFFEKEDQKKGYAGLRRIAAEDGAAVWTALSETEIATQLDKRGGERREEERRAMRDELLGSPAAAPAGGTAPAASAVSRSEPAQGISNNPNISHVNQPQEIKHVVELKCSCSLL